MENFCRVILFPLRQYKMFWIGITKNLAALALKGLVFISKNRSDFA